jgi:hypothetical protein
LELKLSQINFANPQTPQLARHLVTEGSSAGKAMRMDQLWKIALCANNIDVSMRAVQVKICRIFELFVLLNELGCLKIKLSLALLAILLTF